MNNKTTRWLTNLLLCVGTGFMVTGAAALVIGEAVNADTTRTGLTMVLWSFLVIVGSYIVAMLEDE